MNLEGCDMYIVFFDCECQAAAPVRRRSKRGEPFCMYVYAYAWVRCALSLDPRAFESDRKALL